MVAPTKVVLFVLLVQNKLPDSLPYSYYINPLRLVAHIYFLFIGAQHQPTKEVIHLYLTSCSLYCKRASSGVGVDDSFFGYLDNRTYTSWRIGIDNI